LEERGDRQPEAGDDIAAVEVVADLEDANGGRRVVDVDLARVRIDHPDELDAGAEVFLQLGQDLLPGVRRADDLHGEFGDDVPGRLVGHRTIPGPAVERDKGYVGSALEVLGPIDEEE